MGPSQDQVLKPLLEINLVEMTIPDKPPLEPLSRTYLAPCSRIQRVNGPQAVDSTIPLSLNSSSALRT